MLLQLIFLKIAQINLCNTTDDCIYLQNCSGMFNTIKYWDARFFQLSFQLFFLLYGMVFLHWEADGVIYITYVCSGFLFQYGCDSIKHQQVMHPVSWIKGGSYKSALISMLSLCLLLKTNHWQLAILASFITVGSKYLITFKGNHIFNPSALGIIATILFTGQVWISPAQWGQQAVLVFALAALGTIVTLRVQHLAISLVFATAYMLLLWCRQVGYLGWPADYFIQSVSTGSLLLFSFFMLSDPKTSPQHPHARMGWALLVAVLAFYLSQFWFVNGAPIWALVCMQPLVPFINYLLPGQPFQWQQRAAHASYQNITASHLSTNSPSLL
jgi:Na+-transporting NADH:ubiquinone oxidoreductase subunit NqrB